MRSLVNISLLHTYKFVLLKFSSIIATDHFLLQDLLAIFQTWAPHARVYLARVRARVGAVMPDGGHEFGAGLDGNVAIAYILYCEFQDGCQ